ncbi:hypothetical protein [Mesorhizobium sp.]|nr:hypothetical protein [Mesorhizobium sp.]
MAISFAGQNFQHLTPSNTAHPAELRSATFSRKGRREVPYGIS